MRFRSKIILAASMIMALALAFGDRSAYSQGAIDRIKQRLNRTGTVSPGEAVAAANEASALAEEKQRKVEAEIRASEEGGAPPAAMDPEAQLTTDPLAPGSEENIIDPEGGFEGDPELPSVSGMNFGKESEDMGVRDLFSDPAYKDVPFKYNPVGLPDPMVFPQIRNDAIYAELWAMHETLLKEAGVKNVKELARIENPSALLKPKLQEANDALLKIVAMQDPRYTELAQNQIAAVNQLLVGGSGPVELNNKITPVADQPCVLPDEVRANLRFIIAGEGDQGFCLVGDYMVRAGNVIPDFPNVKVLAVSEGKVVFEITGSNCPASTEEVSISPTLDDGFFGSKEGVGFGERSLLGTGRRGRN